MFTTFNATKLWGQLSKLTGETAKTAQHILENYMPDIETILAKGIHLKDFTLHDQDHSFRVAERMVDIVPADVVDKLSPYELAILLFAAYLHDIGMTPNFAKLKQLHTFFDGNDNSGLSDQELESAWRWLDVVDRTRSPESADELLSYYARHKHNDWSELWTRGYFEGTKPLYGGWVNDLVTICRSHHEGYAELINDRINPRITGNSVIHLRYISIALRVADILEFDPERTPEVLFKHRQIDNKSRLYWLKDHEVDPIIDSKQVKMQARPTSALFHRAIDDMIHDIEAELQICKNVSAQRPFSHNPIDPDHPLPHHWDLEPFVLTNWTITNQGGDSDYTYIDGSFRPAPGKLLELLAGLELYRTSLDGVRELLQNAFDAVNEHIAIKRLEVPNPLDKKSLLSLRKASSCQDRRGGTRSTSLYHMLR